jgi:TolB-like protein/Flp pilus assembly protein TadD
MSGFFEEVQRRKVYRVAAAYVIAAGFIIQLASATFPAWELPTWSLRLIIVFLLIGFPISLIFAWAFDLTSQGIQATPKAPTGTHRRRNLILLIATGIIVSATAGFFVLPRLSAQRLDKSIAVLPFENLSSDQENAFFADGIQDDILTNLAKIGDLKVISRTSVMPYRGRAHNIREIAKALGVTAVLEGSVRRDRNRVKVNVQLINATNDEHIWAEDYEGELTDVFKMQRDLADKIAYTLQAKLSPNEHACLERQPTKNPQAYDAYLKARELEGRPDRLRENLKKAEEAYEQAIKLDPAFALAYAKLSHLHAWRYHSDDPVAQRAEKARAAALEALRLQPELPESHHALGYCFYWIDGDYEKALQEFAIAQRGLPNDSETHLAIGAIERRQGKWPQSTANLEKAALLNPKDAWVLENLAFNYVALRDFERVEKTLDRALKIAPQSANLHSWKAKLAFEWKGDLDAAEKAIAAAPAGRNSGGMDIFMRIILFYLKRQFAEGLQFLDQLPQESFKEGEGGGPYSKSYWQGVFYKLLGDEPRAHAAYQRARVVAEEAVRKSPQEAGRYSHLGSILAGLGEKEAAIAAGKRAIELLPESKDAFDGPMMTMGLARIYSLTGEKDEALRMLDHLLTAPNGVTVPILKLDPIWDPLRDDPRFQALLQKHGGKA